MNSDIGDIIELGENWLSQKILVPNDFEVGCEYQIAENEKLETIRLKEKGNDYFFMNFTHPDFEGNSLFWRTNLSIVGHHEKSEVEVSLDTGRQDGVATPVIQKVSRPGLVPDIINKLNASKKGYKLKTGPFLFSEDEIPKLGSWIAGRNRNFPIIFVSTRNYDDKPMISTKYLANQLVGIALVAQGINARSTYKLSETLGRSFGCYDGAVRVYWPINDDLVDPRSHRLWTKEELSKLQNPVDYFLKLMAEKSTELEPLVNLEEVRRIGLARQRKNLEDRLQMRDEQLEQYQELVEIADLENEEKKSIQRELDTMNSREKEYVQAIRERDFRIEALEKLVGDLKDGVRNGFQEEIEYVPCKTITEAIDRADRMYSSLHIDPKVRRSAKKSIYNNPDRVFRAHEWLATTYMELRKPSGKNKKVGGREQINESCLTHTGMQYHPHQSNVTASRYSQDYFINVKGKRVKLNEHLSHGNSKKPTDTIRIGFYYEPQNREVHVGFLDQHPTTSAT